MFASQEQTLNRAIRKLVSDGCGLPPSLVIPGNDDSPSPTSTFASVLPLRTEEQGVPIEWVRDQDSPDEDVDIEVWSQVTGTWSVDWFCFGGTGETPVSLAERFRAWCSSSLAHEQMQAVSITFVRCSAVRQLDELVSQSWELRAQLDLSLAYWQRLSQEAYRVETIPFNLDGASSSLEITETIRDGEREFAIRRV